MIEFNLVYHSCMSSCNLGADESGYTTVVDGINLNLTPLGKMVMPPPMFEKQFALKAHSVCVSMFNSFLCATDSLNNLYFLDCETQNPNEGQPIPVEPLLNLGFALTTI